MWPSRSAEKKRIKDALAKHHLNTRNMPGIANAHAIDTLSQQIVASLRREDYYRYVQRGTIKATRADPNSPKFDAERAVAYFVQQKKIDDACWLIFLMTHFARPADSGWSRLRDVYGKLGTGVWDWQSVSTSTVAFETWLNANWQNISGKFGSHRKYASIRPGAKDTTTDVVKSYISWIGPKGHSAHFSKLVLQGGNDPHAIFDTFYRHLNVSSFGRLGKFDYLSMLRRYSVVPIQAGKAYLSGATGPLNGARLLFDGKVAGRTTKLTLQTYLDALDLDLDVGMEVLEDALCNWQKSPQKFVHFIG